MCKKGVFGGYYRNVCSIDNRSRLPCNRLLACRTLNRNVCSIDNRSRRAVAERIARAVNEASQRLLDRQQIETVLIVPDGFPSKPIATSARSTTDRDPSTCGTMSPRLANCNVCSIDNRSRLAHDRRVKITLYDIATSARSTTDRDRGGSGLLA